MTFPQTDDAGAVALGRQLTVEYYDCDPAVLADAKKMEEIFLAAAERAHAHIIESCFHAFQPQGVSGVVIISESHFAVHAWPEHDYAAVDIFTCGDVIDFDAAVESLRKDLHSENMVVSSMMNRGIVNNFGVERFLPVCEDRDTRINLSWKKRFERTRATGISVALDLYDCRDVTVEKLQQLATDFGEVLNASPAGDFRLLSEMEGIRRFSQDFGTGAFSGCWMTGGGQVYLDLVSSAGYMEPRNAAEHAVQMLKGHHYRMQVAVRQ